MTEYVYKAKNDYENFMQPDVLKRYLDQNRKCTLFVSKMGKKIWKADNLNTGHSTIYK